MYATSESGRVIGTPTAMYEPVPNGNNDCEKGAANDDCHSNNAHGAYNTNVMCCHKNGSSCDKNSYSVCLLKGCDCLFRVVGFFVCFVVIFCMFGAIIHHLTNPPPHFHDNDVTIPPMRRVNEMYFTLNHFLVTYPNTNSDHSKTNPNVEKKREETYKWFSSHPDWQRKYPLHHAAMINDVDAIRQLTSRQERQSSADSYVYDPNAQMKDWFSSQPLGWSASMGHLEATIALIQAGANPFPEQNRAGYTYDNTNSLLNRSVSTKHY